MKSPEKVVWMEGMMMSPQHMQRQDRYHEELVAERLSAAVPHVWGITDVEIDPNALAAGQVRIVRLHGVLPGGVPVAIDHDAGGSIARPAEGHFPATLRVLEVFVGVAHERDGVQNYGGPGARDGNSPRFNVASRRILDAAGSGSEVEVALAAANCVILFGDEDRGDYDSFKVAEIVRDRSGTLTVNERFVPACLRMGASPFLTGGLRQLLAVLVAKQRDLAGALRQGKGSTVEFGAGDVTRFLQLSAFNGIVPVLKHLAESNDLPPRQAYLFLVELFGRLCTFQIDADPTQAPQFVYTDLGATFEELFARITGLLHHTAREQFISVPLETRDGILFAKLDDERLCACDFVLAVHSDELTEAQVADRLPRLSKVSSATGIFPMIRVATSGVPLQHLQRPPAEVPVRAGVVYFAMQQQDQNWPVVLRERSLGVFLPPPFDPGRTRIELLGLPRPTR